MFNTCNIYSGLPKELKEKLEGKSYLVDMFSLSKMANRYNLSCDYLEDFCRKMGMSIIDYRGGRFVLMHKPSVFEHPTTHEKSLVINFSLELNRHGFSKLLKKEFSDDYSSLKWLAHRMIWGVPYANNIIYALNHPVLTFENAIHKNKFIGCLIKSPHQELPCEEINSSRIGSEFKRDDLITLAKIMRQNHSSFRWKEGDLIIIDNLKLAHAGMPGFGSRSIKALMCNPISMTYNKNSIGVYKPKNDEVIECWGAKLAKLGATLPG